MNETDSIPEVSTEFTVDIEKQEKFFEESKERMSKICAQFSYLKKIASKRSVDYTRENIEKMFAYLEKQLADCKAQFMERFNEVPEKDIFDFDFNS